MTDKPAEHATESHHDVATMRQVRRGRVEAAFGKSERAYLEALEALADHSIAKLTVEYMNEDEARLTNALTAAECDAAEKGRH